MTYKKTKQILDFAFALLLLFLLLPVFLVCAILIKIESKGPVFFVQKRIGRDKIHFNIFKFRTMRIDTPSNTPTHLLEQPEKWITRVGNILRKTSIDELPQLINILRGEMSFVGPRPALWNQFDLIEERDKYGVNSLTPGVTGWAQVNGRDLLLIPDKALLDYEYVKRFSLSTDCKLIIKTIIKVLKKEGVQEGGTGNIQIAFPKKDGTDSKK